MNTKVLIVDDEPLACKNLIKKIQGLTFDLDVQYKTDPVEALTSIKVWQPHIVFLDVQMPELDGFDLLDQIPKDERKFALVFCTAYSEYAIKAFEQAAIDYLLKPVDPQRLEESLKRSLLKDPSTIAQLKFDLPRKKYMQRLYVKIKGEPSLIDVSEICYFSSEAHETVVVCETRELICDLSLNALEEQLDPLLFFRSHRSNMVNLRFVSKMNPQTNEIVFTSQVKPVVVSKRAKSDFLKKLKKR